MDIEKFAKLWISFVILFMLGITGFGIWVVVALLKHFGVI